jgi:hypothetical protein
MSEHILMGLLAAIGTITIWTLHTRAVTVKVSQSLAAKPELEFGHSIQGKNPARI